jgi:membrane protease YdiL (CAAX protease family)
MEIGFIALSLSILSLWICPDPKIWGSLLGIAILCAMVSGNISPLGLVWILGLIALWTVYARFPSIALLLGLCIVVGLFTLQLLPGYEPVVITPKLQLKFQRPIGGILSLALFVPLARSLKDWAQVGKGLLIGLSGIAVLAILATFAGVTHLSPKIPPHFEIRAWSNLLLVSIPEEGVYRGLIQRELCRYFHNTKIGNGIAIVMTSVFFTAMHVYWSPDLGTQAFVFLASLLYGGVYLISGKIESAMLTHFLLNCVHMLFFYYHAL